MKFFLASLFSIAAVLSILYLHCFHCGYRDVSFQYLQVSILLVSSALHERDHEKLEMLQNLPQKNEDPVKYRLILDPNMMAEELLDWILQALFKTKQKKTKKDKPNSPADTGWIFA